MVLMSRSGVSSVMVGGLLLSAGLLVMACGGDSPAVTEDGSEGGSAGVGGAGGKGGKSGAGGKSGGGGKAGASGKAGSAQGGEAGEGTGGTSEAGAGGEAGTSGKAGSAGKGSSGTSGASGTSGSSGTSGQSGTSGAAGTSSCAPKTCADEGHNCGTIDDGCGNSAVSCGDCPTGQTCGGAGVFGQCGEPPCAPTTCAAQGFNCGPAGDGCGKQLDCGSCPGGQTCGGTSPGVCGSAVCTPHSCSDQGISCGPAGDGCGNQLSCGDCPTGQTCGGGGKAGVCGAPSCTPKTCSQLGKNCGQVGDGCGNIIQCGGCGLPEVCGGGGTQGVCGTPSTCTGLCLQQTTCAQPGVTTTVSGTVYAPNGVDPLPNAAVYIPNSKVEPFTPGVTCDTCGAPASGSPLVSVVTTVDGKFTLKNVPVGKNIPLVIQLGRWRRQITIPTVSACTDTKLTAAQTHLPRNKAEGDIPLMAFSTGSVDALECVVRKIGVDDAEFTAPSGTGRVHLYMGLVDKNSQFGLASGGAKAVGSPGEDQLWGTQAALNKYDIVFFPCQADQTTRTHEQVQRLINYANAGGRVFTTHFSYIWLYKDAPFSSTAQWNVEQHPSPSDQDGYVNTTFPKGKALSQWLTLVGASTTAGRIPLQVIRHDHDAVVTPSQSWMTIDKDPNFPGATVHYTFNTPVGAPSEQQCGRVLYDDFHVENVSASKTVGVTFPQECLGGNMTAQEKLLEYMIFDLASCVTPDVPVCKPVSCEQQGIGCGATGDGCGNIIQCGTCPVGQTCGGGGTPSQCGAPACTPKSCAAQGISCGPAGDGCGNLLGCGSCPEGQTCGGGGKPGVCGAQTCTPTTCKAQNIACGPAGDGCGNQIACGDCPVNQTCGGGGVPGQCGAPACTPKSCAEQGKNCGPTGDGCGNIVQCGDCAVPQTCGGGGTPGVCGGNGKP